MSGTSLDGLDMVACTFWQEGAGNWKYELIASETVKYDDAQKKKLMKARRLDGLSLINLDLKFGGFMGRSLNKFIHRHDLNPALIASHGHTIFHQPRHHLTYQIGNGNAINLKTGVKTITDFRTADVLNGGQGAPLVPVGDRLLFGDYEYCLNLGGIANICDQHDDTSVAFDICPCNMVLNDLANEAGFEFDRDGILASQGQLIEDLLLDLNALDYYQQSGPKSLGVEWYEAHFKPFIKSHGGEIHDQIYTVTHHIAYQIAQRTETEGSKLLVTGGGARNKLLVKEIDKLSKAQVVVPAEDVIDYKEAIIFGLLGLLRDLGIPNTLASATGAEDNLVTGTVHQNHKA